MTNGTGPACVSGDRPSEWLSIEATARHLGWEGPGTRTSPHPRTVSDWCASGELRAYQRTRPNGVYKVRRSDADAFMRRHMTPAPARRR